MKAEANLQKQCIEWFRWQYSNYKKLLYANENGMSLHGIKTYLISNFVESYAKKRAENGAKSFITKYIAKLKQQGLTPGVPDLFLAKANKEYAGLYIELKTGNNKLSVSQKEFISNIQDLNEYKTLVIYTLDSFIVEVNEYLNNV